MRKKTYHDGRNDQMTAILAKVRREIKNSADGYSIDGGTFLEWLLRCDARNRKRPGGL